jgi:hypothetical protein
MPAMASRMRIGATVLIGCVALGGGLATLGQDQPARRQTEPAPDKPTEYLWPASNCEQCHSHPEQYAKRFNAGQLLCKMDEFTTWDHNDKHRKAYEVLQGERGQAIGKRLGIEVTESASCTNCHGTNVPGTVQFEPAARAENGVTCVACHGAFQEWVQQHRDPDVGKWATYKGIEGRRLKEDRFGMTDLWDPVTRATKCASCHIGSAKEQKVLTHAMYAAGHPPLPGLEAATFSQAQPNHWLYTRSKPDKVKERLGFNPAKPEQTELVVASGIVALAETMRLYAAEARNDALVKEPASPWPDFARFDCYACHHDLKVPSWRQERGYGGRTPGRPPVPAWPDVLVQLSLTVADPDGAKGRLSEYLHARDAFYAATSSRPFGDREQSAAAADTLASWADAVAQDLRGVIKDPKRVAVDARMALRLLHRLCQRALTAPLDYDSARQVAWSFKIIYQETRAIDPKVLNDPELGKQIDDLFDKLHLALPSAGKQVSIVDSLPARLSAVFDFDPEAFQAHFAAIAQHLPPP